MDRRAFITMVGWGILAAPLAAEAQHARGQPRVGFLTGPTGTGTTFFDAFRQGLEELGWKDGQNIALEYRVSPSEQIPQVAADLVRTQVDVIVLTATSIRSARQATATVPVVFVIADDPVGAGFVSSLAPARREYDRAYLAQRRPRRQAP